MRALVVSSLVLVSTTNIYAETGTSTTAPLQLVQTIPLPGVKGKFDHLVIDVAEHRVFVAAKINNTVEVVDLHSARRIRSLSGFAEPQGILYLPDKQLVVANGGN